MATPLDFSALRNALVSLDQSLAILDDRAWFDSQSEAVRRTLEAGAIQNVEFVYELAIKLLRRQLEREASSPADVDQASFRDLLRSAGEKGLVADVERWCHMRNLTAHTYDRTKAAQVLADAALFAHDARALLAALESRDG
ncbi:MAG: nucleotidyltransferase substrate binding protein [Xanthomonadales bacterium]|nr:nucleotidyltransferase substrate binding protein [Xanthomonadales bacterium]